MDLLENTLLEEQKDLFHETIQLFYQTEEYYFALAYSLGVKYGQDLTELLFLLGQKVIDKMQYSFLIPFT